MNLLEKKQGKYQIHNLHVLGRLLQSANKYKTFIYQNKKYNYYIHYHCRTIPLQFSHPTKHQEKSNYWLL